MTAINLTITCALQRLSARPNAAPVAAAAAAHPHLSCRVMLTHVAEPVRLIMKKHGQLFTTNTCEVVVVCAASCSAVSVCLSLPLCVFVSVCLSVCLSLSPLVCLYYIPQVSSQLIRVVQLFSLRSLCVLYQESWLYAIMLESHVKGIKRNVHESREEEEDGGATSESDSRLASLWGTIEVHRLS